MPRRSGTGKEYDSLNYNYNSSTDEWEPVSSSPFGGQSVEIVSSQTAFGELNVATNRAFIQAAPVYGFLPANFRAYTSSGGSGTIEGNEFKVTSGTSVGGYGAIQSFRSLNYKAGEGGLVRFTARFPNNYANSWQGVGAINIGDELSFGYNGTSFGIWHRYHGKAEVRLLTLSAGASGAETATIFVNGTSYSVSLTSGSTAKNAKEIADYMTANISDWTAWQNAGTVLFVALSDSAKSGTFSFSSTGTAAASWSTVTTGVEKTSDFVAQSSWNQNTMSSLDPAKGNVYQINYQYLGYGNIFFSVEDPDTGKMTLVHVLKIANTKTRTSVGNPSFHLGMYAANITNTSNITVYSASMAGFVQGEESKTRNPRAQKSTKTVSSGTLTNLLTLRNKRAVNGIVNQAEIEPYFVSVASESTKNVVVEIYGNASVAGDVNFQDVGSNLLSEYDVDGTTVSNGTLLLASSVSPNSSSLIDLTAIRLRFPPTLTFTIAARVTGGAASAITASLVWYEDV